MTIKYAYLGKVTPVTKLQIIVFLAIEPTILSATVSICDGRQHKKTRSHADTTSSLFDIHLIPVF